MANVTVVVNDDYSTISAALAAMPSDLVAMGGIYEVQIRKGINLSSRIKIPDHISNANNYLSITAFVGDQSDGKGGGVKLSYNHSFYATIEFNTGSDNTRLSKITIENTNESVSSNAVKLLKGYDLHFDDMVILGGSAFQNGSNGSGHFENVIHDVKGMAKPCFGGGNIGGNWTFNRNTFFGGGVGTFGVGYNGSLSGTFAVTNSLSVDFAEICYRPDISGNYNASSDNSSSSFSSNFLSGRVSTDDLEDPYGAIPNYNLKTTSSLKGAGENGSDIGAYLDSTNSPQASLISATLLLPSVTASGNVDFSLPVYQAQITAQIPAIVASVTGEHVLPVYQSQASIELPGLVAQGFIEFGSLNYHAAANVTLPGIVASVTGEHVLPVYQSQASIELPGLVAQGFIEFGSLNYHAAANVTLPGIVASVTGEHVLPVYQSQANIELPGITAVINYDAPPIGYGNIIVLRELSTTITFLDHNQPLIIKG